MAAGQSSSNRITAVFAIVILGVVAWWIAPIFLPVWGWLNLDYQKLAQRFDIPAEELRQEYRAVLYYNPRGKGDPTPWQLIKSQPYFERVDEYEVKVRVHLISDRTGEPPGTLTMGSTYKDRFFGATIRRFPAGAFGRSGPRPVVVYEGGSLIKVPLVEAQAWESMVGDYYSDDFWEGRYDGWEPGLADDAEGEDAAGGEDPERDIGQPIEGEASGLWP